MSTEEMNRLTEKIIGCAIEVHKTLGPGLLESVYEECLAIELEYNGIKFVQQQRLPIVCRTRKLKSELVMDILVEDTVVVELKSVDELAPIHEAQLLTYLKLSKRRIGLLINFNVPLLKQGIRRMVL